MASEYTQDGPVSSDFASLTLDAVQLTTLSQLGFVSMTPIQAQALPVTLAGRDLIAQAATGSGKTAVFALTLLARLNPKFFGVQALILCPTRELADQVSVEVRKLGRGIGNLKVVTLCGGVPIRGQLDSLSHGAHVVVGTPGRVLDHLKRKSLVLDGLRNLILDEADRMLEMGFSDDMAAVAGECPLDRQTLLFSATYPPEIEAVAAPFLSDPLRVQAATTQAGPAIEQRFYEAPREAKPALLATLLEQGQPESTLVFVNTKAAGREVTAYLQQRGFSARDLSGDLEQRDRDEVMALFMGRCLSVVVATDVASRGLDVSKLDLVVNYDITPDPEVHVHRVGRTGRAGESGVAVSLVAPHEVALVRRIEELTGQRPTWTRAPVESEPRTSDKTRLKPPMVMLKFLDGKKDKIRPGDVLGALTVGLGLGREDVGTIKVTEWGTWVAVRAALANRVVAGLESTPVKGKIRRLVRLSSG